MIQSGFIIKTIGFFSEFNHDHFKAEFILLTDLDSKPQL